MKKIKWSNLLFIVFLALVLIPQTRKPIQIALNQVKVKLFTPSAFAKADTPSIAPFVYQVMDGQGIRNEMPVGQGRVTFISYWATWCPPCIAELPTIASLYEKYGNRVDFLLLTNEEPLVVEKFMTKKGYNLPVSYARMETPEALKERTIPTNYIIDKKGNIVVKEQGAQNWDSESVHQILDSLLKD